MRIRRSRIGVGNRRKRISIKSVLDAVGGEELLKKKQERNK